MVNTVIVVVAIVVGVVIWSIGVWFGKASALGIGALILLLAAVACVFVQSTTIGAARIGLLCAVLGLLTVMEQGLARLFRRHQSRTVLTGGLLMLLAGLVGSMLI